MEYMDVHNAHEMHIQTKFALTDSETDGQETSSEILCFANKYPSEDF